MFDKFGFVQSLLASCTTVSGAKRDETKFLPRSSDNLRLSEENRRLKKVNKALENLHSSLKSQNDLLNEKVSEQEEIIQKCKRRSSWTKVLLTTFGVLSTVITQGS